MYVAKSYCDFTFASLYEVVSVRPSVRPSVGPYVPCYFWRWKERILGASFAVYPALLTPYLIGVVLCFYPEHFLIRSPCNQWGKETYREQSGKDYAMVMKRLNRQTKPWTSDERTKKWIQAGFSNVRDSTDRWDVLATDASWRHSWLSGFWADSVVSIIRECNDWISPLFPEWTDWPTNSWRFVEWLSKEMEEKGLRSQIEEPHHSMEI